MTNPNNDGVEGLIAKLVRRFFGFGKASMQGILGLAETICEAHEELGGKHLKTFYESIHVEMDGATSKKLRKIGQARTRFLPVFDKCPAYWTSLYWLACVSDDEFRQLVDGGILHPLASLEELQSFIAKPGRDPDEPVRKVTLDINKVGPARRKEFLQELQGLLKRYNLDFEKKQKANLTEFFKDGEGSDANVPV